MKNSVVSEEEIRKIVRKALLKENVFDVDSNLSDSDISHRVQHFRRDLLGEGQFGSITAGLSSLGSYVGKIAGSAVKSGAAAAGDDISNTGGGGLSGSHEVDSSKLKRKGIDLNSVREMSQKTGLRADFVYGIQSRESAGNPSAMALNPHITINNPKGYRWAVGSAKLKKFMGDEGKEKWKEAIRKMKSLGVRGKSIPGVTKQGFNHPVYQKMRSVDPELAILGNALGYYQVLGGHLLPYWDFSAEKMEREFENDPKGFSHKAFIIWVKKHPNFLKKVNEGEENWRAQVASYYGEDNKDYTDHVIAAAKEYRDAVINNQTDDGAAGVGGAGGGFDSWKGKENKIFARGINFHRLKSDLPFGGGLNNFRSGIKPKHVNATPEFFRQLSQDFGIDTVITLNADNGGKKASEAAAAAGLNVMYAPSSDSGGSLNMQNYTFEDIVKQLDKGNTLIHCTHGADRTGAVVGRYYVRKGMSVEDALQDAYKYKSGGKSGFKKGPTEYIRLG